jgi:hypothetical protein
MAQAPSLLTKTTPKHATASFGKSLLVDTPRTVSRCRPRG